MERRGSLVPIAAAAAGMAGMGAMGAATPGGRVAGAAGANPAGDGAGDGRLFSRAGRGWDLGKSRLIGTWAELAAGYGWLHDAAGRMYKTRAGRLIVPATVLSTLTGAMTATLGSLFAGPQSQYAAIQPYIAIGLGGLSMLAGLLLSLEQKFGYTKLAEQHARAATDWRDLYTVLLTCLALQYDHRPYFDSFLETVQTSLLSLLQNMPPVPRKAIVAYRREYAHVPGLRHPYECGALAPTPTEPPTPAGRSHASLRSATATATATAPRRDGVGRDEEHGEHEHLPTSPTSPGRSARTTETLARLRNLAAGASANLPRLTRAGRAKLRAATQAAIAAQRLSEAAGLAHSDSEEGGDGEGREGSAWLPDLSLSLTQLSPLASPSPSPPASVPTADLGPDALAPPVMPSPAPVPVRLTRAATSTTSTTTTSAASARSPSLASVASPSRSSASATVASPSRASVASPRSTASASAPASAPSAPSVPEAPLPLTTTASGDDERGDSEGSGGGEGHAR